MEPGDASGDDSLSSMMMMFRLGLVLLFCALASACAPYTPTSRGESIERNIRYAVRDTGGLRLDIYKPAGTAPYPTVLWIHGGGWKYGTKGWMLWMRDLTREGFAVVSIQYRLSNKAYFPAQIEDTRDALAWLRAHGSEHGLATDRVFVAGSSAGGHLAALLAVQEGRSKIAAACVLYPATDLLGFENQDAHKGYLPWVLGGSVNEKRKLAERGSPVRFVRPDAPPFLFYHGDGDTLVPLKQSEDLHAKLRAAGVESRLNVLHGVGHNFPLDETQLHEVASFFRNHMRR